jgi:hypothetical protein
MQEDEDQQDDEDNPEQADSAMSIPVSIASPTATKAA